MNAERLIFSSAVPLDEHLARLKLADLALDTGIYNGGATTSNALWAGVPVITKKGKHFVSRMTASSLDTIGLPDLIVNNLEEYEKLAVRLTKNRFELSNIQTILEKNRLTAPLFDTARFVKNLEAAYRQMWRTFVAGGRAEQIEIKDCLA